MGAVVPSSPQSQLCPYFLNKHHSRPFKMPSLQGVVPAGVVTGANLMKLLEYCRDNEMALPAFNCTSSSTVNAVLQAARDANSAVMIQVSHVPT